ncbi:MAG TPA: AI-2E family transporter [Candidatus Limnocylindria bacterium]|nr:AI-2E family transporter [Candidatus Limnocylindria bacterium]
MTRVLVVAAALAAVMLALRLVFEALTELSHIIVLVVFGVVIAFVLAPLVDLIRRLVRRRDLAVALTAVTALVVMAAAIVSLAVPLIRETRELADNVPRYAALLSSDEPLSIGGLEISGEVRQRIGAEIGARIGDWSQDAARAALRVGAGIIDFFFMFVLGVYLLASAPQVRRWITTVVVPDRQRADFKRIEAEAARLFGAYIRGQLLLGLIVGTVSGIAYVVLGVPYAVFLGVLAGVFELVPIVGPVAAGAVAALVALTQPFPLVIWVVLAAIAVQQLENNLLVPRISGGAVGLHPLAALLAVLVGVEIAGVIGALFAVPLTGLAWSIYRARRETASVSGASR